MDGGNHSIFVHGLTELEMNLMRELLEVFCKDRNRKWLSYTMKNTKYDDCSLLTILLVQPCTAGEEVRVQEYSRTVCVDDLPSPEKSTGGPKQSCTKLTEEGNVKGASITLKPNLDVAKQNPTPRVIKVLPYCQPGVIELLENYFDEEDKTVDARDTSQQQHHNEESLTCEDAKYFTKNNHREEESHTDAASGCSYSLGPSFPLLMLNSNRPDNSHKDLIRFLEQRMIRSSQLISNLYENQNDFRGRLIVIQKENDLFKRKIHIYKDELGKEKKRVQFLESKLLLLKSHVTAFKKDVDEKERVIKVLGRKLHEKNLALKKLDLEKHLIKQKYSNLLVSESEEISQKMQKQLKIQSELERDLEVKDKKLKQIKQILNIAPPGSHILTSGLNSSHNLRAVVSGEVTLN